jgi:hypothetical protein
MTALALLGMAPDSLEDRLEAARAAQSWLAVAIAVCVAVVLFWLVSKLGNDDADVAPAKAPAPPAPASPARISRPSVPTYSGVSVSPLAEHADPGDETRAA